MSEETQSVIDGEEQQLDVDQLSVAGNSDDSHETLTDKNKASISAKRNWMV